jgi:hypothetical protein
MLLLLPPLQRHSLLLQQQRSIYAAPKPRHAQPLPCAAFLIVVNSKRWCRHGAQGC